MSKPNHIRYSYSIQIHLLDPSSTTENLEGLGTLVKSVHDARQQDAFLRTVKGLIESKDGDIEKICGDNYQVRPHLVSILIVALISISLIGLCGLGLNSFDRADVYRRLA